jgi:hypothetical protein
MGVQPRRDSRSATKRALQLILGSSSVEKCQQITKVELFLTPRWQMQYLPPRRPQRHQRNLPPLAQPRKHPPRIPLWPTAPQSTLTPMPLDSPLNRPRMHHREDPIRQTLGQRRHHGCLHLRATQRRLERTSQNPHRHTQDRKQKSGGAFFSSRVQNLSSKF